MWLWSMQAGQRRGVVQLLSMQEVQLRGVVRLWGMQAGQLRGVVRLWSMQAGQLGSAVRLWRVLPGQLRCLAWEELLRRWKVAQRVHRLHCLMLARTAEGSDAALEHATPPMQNEPVQD